MPFPDDCIVNLQAEFDNKKGKTKTIIRDLLIVIIYANYYNTMIHLPYMKATMLGG